MSCLLQGFETSEQIQQTNTAEFSPSFSLPLQSTLPDRASSIVLRPADQPQPSQYPARARRLANPAMAEVETRLDTGVAVVDDAQDAQDGAQELALTTTNNEVAAPTEKKVKKIIRRKKRPARPQIDPALIKSEPPPQTGTVFNIWYNKWSGGDREDKYLSQTHAKGRCNVAQDSGYTRADARPGSYFCLFFARGIWYVRFPSSPGSFFL